MKKVYLIVSDSGGVQEEASVLGKPFLVLRDETECSEAVDMRVVKLVGSSYERIVKEFQLLLDAAITYNAMARGVSWHGDGKGAEHIVSVFRNNLL